MLRKIRFRLVFNRSGVLNKRGEGLIQIECQQDGRKIYFSTHTYVRPEHFCDGSVCGTPNSEALNYALYMMVQEVERVELEYIRRGVPVTLPLLKDAVRSHVSPAAKLSDFGLEVIGQSDRHRLTKLNYKTLLNDLEKFRRGMLLTDIDYGVVVKYDRWLSERVGHNTRVSRLRLLRALLNEARKRDLITINPFDRFRIQQMVSKKGYVTSEQLRRLERMKLDSREDMVRDAFLVGCYTGLRFSDVISLRQEHLRDGWLTKRMVKTGFMVEVPVGRLFEGRLLAIVEKYGGDIGRLTKELGSNQHVNKTLKQLLEDVGADTKLTFHSSRHTFATLLGQKGVEITTIQKLLGHQKLQTTQIYRETTREGIVREIEKVNRKRRKEPDMAGK